MLILIFIASSVIKIENSSPKSEFTNLESEFVFEAQNLELLELELKRCQKELKEAEDENLTLKKLLIKTLDEIYENYTKLDELKKEIEKGSNESEVKNKEHEIFSTENELRVLIDDFKNFRISVRDITGPKERELEKKVIELEAEILNKKYKIRRMKNEIERKIFKRRSFFEEK